MREKRLIFFHVYESELGTVRNPFLPEEIVDYPKEELGAMIASGEIEILLI